MQKRGHFDIRELVSEADFKKYGLRAWRFVCPALLHTLNTLRDDLGCTITVNNWIYGGKINWRGVRTSKCADYSETSMHAWGRAADFDVKGMTAPEVVVHVIKNRDKYPLITFIEIDINWVHIDVGQREHNPAEGLKLWSPKRKYVDIDTYLKEQGHG